ncbi:hypothetical protein [Massilia eburnea]|nr:hypothetical protein [Massilia eburnea]
MPGAEPETGSWNTPEPEGFSSDSEKSLIAYLARQQKAGADFNAYRHNGTLLHHAIRAGKPATALWLLQHGADPKLKAEGADAMELCVRFNQPKVGKVLSEKYSMSPPAIQRTSVVPAGAAAATPHVAPYQRVQEAVGKNAKTPAALDKALAALPAGMLAEHYGVALPALAKAGNVPADSWRTLWRHLGKFWNGQYDAGFAATIPFEQWPALVAAGYRNDSAERALGCMVAESTAADLKLKWPALEKNFSDFRQVAARMVLQSYRIPAVGSPYCSRLDEKELKAKLEWLRASDIKAQVSGIATAEMKDFAPATKLAMQPYIAKPADKPRFSSVTPQCKFTLDDAWLKHFATADVPLYGISLVEVPGEAQCAVLASWEPRSEYPTGLVDGFTGPTWESTPSCADVPEHQVLWRNTKEGIVKLEHEIDLSSLNFPAPVRDNVSGQLYYLDNGQRAGKCSGPEALPFLYEWQRKDGQWRLAAPDSRELQEALFAQCSAAGAENCKGIKWPADGDPYYYMPYSDFLRRFAGERRSEYLAAVMALDKEKLQKIEAGPLPATWVGEAISAVGKSDLPLAEKRKRIAHLFYDHERLARAMEDLGGYDLLHALVAWLPAEDWAPIFGLMRQYPYRFYPQGVRQEAENQKKARLACDLDNLLGLVCGEKLEN